MDNGKFKSLCDAILKGEEVSDQDLYDALAHDAEKRNGDLQKRRNVVQDLDLDDLRDEPKPEEGLL